MPYPDTSCPPPQQSATSGARRKWTKPQVVRVKAGDAENSIDPIVPDGGVTFGS